MLALCSVLQFFFHENVAEYKLIFSAKLVNHIVPNNLGMKNYRGYLQLLRICGNLLVS